MGYYYLHKPIHDYVFFLHQAHNHIKLAC